MAAEKHQQEAVKSALAQNKTLSMLDEILEDVRKAADRLEEEIEEHAFDNNKHVIYIFSYGSSYTPWVQCSMKNLPQHNYRCEDEGGECRGSVESGGG